MNSYGYNNSDYNSTEEKNKKSNKKRSSGSSATINIGSSSLLMIFVVLCLVSFATLSIVSANADKKLSLKVAEHSVAYYDACNQAEQRIAQIDASLLAAYENSADENEYFDQVGHVISFAIPVTDVHTLNISLDIIYPDSADEMFYQITCYNLTPTGTLELDESLPVM